MARRLVPLHGLLLLLLACAPTSPGDAGSEGGSTGASDASASATATTGASDPSASASGEASTSSGGSGASGDTSGDTSGTSGGVSTSTSTTGGDATTGAGTTSGTGGDTSSGGESGETGATPGFGDVVGECWQLAGELDSPEPSLYEVRLDFGMDVFDDPGDADQLTPGGQKILFDPNAGGSSVISETFAFEVLARCQGASLIKTETEIVYDPPNSKKTDILVSIAGEQVGVSVTRAVKFPPEADYTEADAAFIAGKLEDVLISTMNVVPEDGWGKQILVIMAYADMHAAAVEAVWAGLDPAVRADTIVYVVVTDGEDTPIYFQ